MVEITIALGVLASIYVVKSALSLMINFLEK